MDALALTETMSVQSSVTRTQD